MRKIWIIVQKEILDNLRDYHSWVTGVFWALFGPLIMGAMILLLGNQFREQIELPLDLPVLGRENAPNLIVFLGQNNIIVSDAPTDPRAAVVAGDVNAVLIIPPGFGEDFSKGKTATLQLVYDSSRQSAMPDIARIRNALEGYGNYIGSLRLIVRGISPEVVQPVLVEDVDTATPQSQALIFLSMLPYFIIFAIFNGASPIITDATAGERERGSLEPLLINPIPRGWVAIGKMLSAIPFATANLAITLAGFAAIFQVLPVEEIMGLQIGLDIRALLAIFVVCFPVTILACAILNLIASFTRTTKEAGTYLPFIGLIPSLPGIALAFLPVKPALWTMLIPTFGQQILINQFLRSEPILFSNIIISAVMTLIVAFVFILAAVKLYGTERILLGK